MKRPTTGPVIRNDDVWDMCDCTADLMMAWYVDGTWVPMFAIDDTRNVEADAREYDAVNANAWMIGCPTCGRVYARGIH